MIVLIGKALALAIHNRQLAEHGGGEGVRDEGLLDSALARPQQLHHYGDPPPECLPIKDYFSFDPAKADVMAALPEAPGSADCGCGL